MADLGTRMASMAATKPEGPRPEHTEGVVARTIEHQTAKLPSDLFLWAAGASMVGSLTLKCCGREHDALFVGQWAAPFLVLGLYNKLVKIAGSDPASAPAHNFPGRPATSGYSSGGGM
jgi:hypothetical protein